MDSSPNVTELPLTKPIQPNTNELPPKEIAKRAGISLGRGFAVGFTGKALLSLLSVLQTLRKKQKSKKSTLTLVCRDTKLGLVLQSSFSGAFKYGCFVGNLTGVSTLLLLLSHRFAFIDSGAPATPFLCVSGVAQHGAVCACFLVCHRETVAPNYCRSSSELLQLKVVYHLLRRAGSERSSSRFVG